MPNPILERINQSSNPMAATPQPYQSNANFIAAKNLYKIIQNSNNSVATAQALAAKNPQLQQIMNLATASNKDYHQLFIELAKQRGIDPNQFIQELTH